MASRQSLFNDVQNTSPLKWTINQQSRKGFEKAANQRRYHHTSLFVLTGGLSSNEKVILALNLIICGLFGIDLQKVSWGLIITSICKVLQKFACHKLITSNSTVHYSIPTLSGIQWFWRSSSSQLYNRQKNLRQKTEIVSLLHENLNPGHSGFKIT